MKKNTIKNNIPAEHLNEYEFRRCKGYYGKYFVREDGQIWNAFLGRYISQSLRGGGQGDGRKNVKQYMRVSLNGESVYVHRVVGDNFLENPEKKPMYDHVDENKLNNHYTNLMPVTNQENARNHHARKRAKKDVE